MSSTAAALVRAASGTSHEIRGAVCLTASEIVGAEVLPSILTGLREHHPLLSFELVLSNRTEDLLRREVDLAIRMVRPTQASLVAKKIGHVTLGLHAHRRYLDAHGTPRSLDDVDRHDLIGYDQETPVIRSLRTRGMKFTRDMFTLRTDSDLAHLAAIRAGFGIGVCQIPMGRKDPDLVHLLPKAFAFDLEIWVVMHENLRASRRMRVVFDYLAAALSDYVRSRHRAPTRKDLVLNA